MLSRLLLLFTILSLLLCLPAIGQAEDPVAILDKAIQAHGGIEKLAAIKAEKIKSQGKGVLAQPVKIEGIVPGKVQVLKEGSFTGQSYYEFPGRFKEKADFHFKVPLSRQAEADISLVLDNVLNEGKAVALMNGDPSPTPADLSELKEKVHRRQICWLACLKDKAYTLSALNGEEVAGKPTVALRVKAKGFQDVDLFFDKQTGLLVKMRYQARENDKPVTEEEIVAGYQQVGGVTAPKKIVVKRNGKQIREEEFLKIGLLDKPLDRKVFNVQ